MEFELREAGQVKEKSAIGVIFSPRYAVGTVMLCLTYFMGLLIFYLLTSWLPLLIRETGASMESGLHHHRPVPAGRRDWRTDPWRPDGQDQSQQGGGRGLVADRRLRLPWWVSPPAAWC
ncbi:hypothetical protein LNP17_29455 [Klebsiella variicola subsp. variicola]|nr:hypothetical protein [Klebsiella variicola subsp. variicola]